MTRLCRYAFSVGVVVGFIQLPAAMADSLPTFTATSASATVQYEPIRWSISGYGFGLGGGGLGPNFLAVDVAPGSSFGFDLIPGLDPLSLASYSGGSSGNTTGYVTIDGTTDSVQLQTTPQINFSTAGVTVPFGPDPVIRLAATLTGSGVAAECLGPGLVPINAGEANGFCYGFLDVANIDIDVPGVITFRGSYDAEGIESFGFAQFTTSPEPVSGGLMATGLVLLAGIVGLRLFKSRRYTAPFGRG
jgi:hypothetical protein